MKALYIFLFLSFSFLSFGQEICNNAIDDDGDGLIDLNDPDCNCNATTLTSIIPNYSFETHTACPTSFSIPGNDQLSLANPWIQATNATSDYHNTCGYVMPAITSAGLTNFPEGTAVAGAIFLNNWKEYLGSPLLSPMLAGTNYQLTFSVASLVCDGQGYLVNTNISNYDPVNLTLFGCADGTNLPLNTESTPDSFDSTWVEIGNVTYTPATVWGEVTITFTPNFNVNAIMLGSPLVLPSAYTSITGDVPYFVFDKLLLNEASVFGVNIAHTGSFCENNLILSANVTNTVSSYATYQWYFNGIAILGATNTSYIIPPFPTSLGQYSVKVTDGSQCYISSKLTVNNTLSAPSFTTIQPTCIVPTGTITITTSALQYSFDNGVTWQNSPTKSGLPIGNYFIKIKTPNGCISASYGVSVLQPQFLNNSALTIVQPTVCGAFGSITVNSTIAVEYSFDNGVTWTTNATANNLVPGTYLVIVRDVIGCQSGAQTVYINQVYISSPTYTSVQPTCDTYGTITITTSADEYSFDNGVTWTTNSTAVLPYGSYLIKVRNNNGCLSYSQYVFLNKYFIDITPTVDIIQPICGTGGTITITTTAAEYSFDNGITWTTNNVANNLNPGSYVIYIRDNPNCTSYSQYVYLYNSYLPAPEYTSTDPECNLGGSITITTIADEYSFDGGSTWTTNPVATNLSAGTYYILIKNFPNCTSETSYVNLNYFYLDNPLYEYTNPYCGANGTITITSVANEYSFNGGFSWTTNPVATNLSAGTYYIKIRNGLNCVSQYVYFYLTDLQNTSPSYTKLEPGCNSYGSITIDSIADEYSFDGGTTWTTNPILNGLIGNQTYILLIKKGNCISLSSNATLYNSYESNPIVTNYTTLYCDALNDTNEVINLNQFNSNFIADVTNYTFTYYNTLLSAENQTTSEQIANPSYYSLNINKTFFVRVTSINTGCYSIAELTIDLINSPVISLKDEYILCENKFIQLNADLGYNSYYWSTGATTNSIIITQAGNYSLTVTKNYGSLVCSTTKNYKVILSNPAKILTINTEDWTDNNNTMTVLLTSSSVGNYAYSLDGINYQTSNIFSGLESGEYEVFIKDVNGCGIITDDFYLLMYPKFFTPNGDGFNDFWKVRLSQKEPDFKTAIFDRYGKLLKTMNSFESWDGKLNGKDLPSTDYWFLVTRQNGKEFRGHFTMKR